MQNSLCQKKCLDFTPTGKCRSPETCCDSLLRPHLVGGAYPHLLRLAKLVCVCVFSVALKRGEWFT